MTSSPGRCVVLACGGTGGHIFPAFSVAEELKRWDPSLRLVYVCGNKDIENAIFRIITMEKVFSIDSAPFRGSRSLFNPSFLIKLFRGFIQSYRILRAERPAIVVGFGGHFSFPVLVVARLLGIRTMIHEQNVMPGFANKILVSWVSAVALSFEETRSYLSKHPRMLCTGNPIRASIEKDCRNEGLEFFGFSSQKKTVLVLGGSQGAESINTVFLEALKLLPETLRLSLQVIHLTGKMSTALAEDRCAREGVTARAFSFFERMDLAYGVADVAIGRAGATFLAEAKAKRLPAILVPYPFAGGHQLLNARAFLAGGFSKIIEQSELTAEILAETLTEFLERTIEKQPIQENSRMKLTGFIKECCGWN